MGSLGQLPPKDSPHIHLTTLTPTEHLAQTDANSSEWSGALNKEQYFRREAHLGDQDLTRGGGLTAWGLVYQPNGQEGRTVLAGCETYVKKGVVVKDGKMEEGVVHGVGSVFCPPEARGMGYAGRMMEDLGKRLRDWQGKKALGSVLYSDIGKVFYAKKGWRAMPSRHVALPPKESAVSGLPETQLLKADDLPALCQVDEQLLRRRLEKRGKNEQPALALIPDIATIRWHHAREEFVANELYGKEPLVKGAVAGKEGERVWCYWTRIFTNPAKEPPVLHILRLVVEDEAFSDFEPASETAAEKKESPIVQAVAAVFAEAQKQAKEWGMSEVQMWNPSGTTLAGARVLEEGAKVVEREEDSIASLNWFGEGQEVEWVCNEKYGWC